ncbi:MAG: hypothetical protein J6J04_05910, partial [Oscillospiraceae bacterium]|nr:hypothetical protein [Oscillospiraceae bacterium]
EIETPNLEIGYLKPDRFFIQHHEAIEAVEEQGHYEVVAEYPNGGKDVEWVVDMPGVKAQEAWDEYEDILRYVLYDEEQLAEMEVQRKAEEERQARYEVLMTDGVTWTELAAALTEGVNSV